MNATLVATNAYENKRHLLPLAKQTQNKPNFQEGKMDATLVTTKDYENERHLLPLAKQTQFMP
ncbi:MAG TPA: hypothetical protein VMW16_14040 [Sedimentisphaerales bacterium]|nr:hypothetical protein [Sedimentisphaerales bacterium]